MVLHLTFFSHFFCFLDVDLFAWSDTHENYANHFTSSQWTFHAAAAPQLNCIAGNDLENVQMCGGASIADVFA